MKIVHIPRRFAPQYWGGTESVLASLCRELKDLGHQQLVLTTRALDATPQSQLEGVPVHRFPYFYPYLGLSSQAQEQLDKRGGNLFSWQLGWHLWRQPQLDLIHLHTGKRLGGLARWVARRKKIPYVMSLHGGVYDVPAGEAASWTEPTRGSLEWGKVLGWMVGSRRLLDDADLILCLGRKEQARLQQAHPGTRVEWFPNGVQAHRFAQGDRRPWRQRCGLADSDRLLLCVGRLDPQKNQALALQVLARLPDSHHLLLLGACTDSQYLESLKQMAQQLGVSQRVHGWEAASGQSLVDAYAACDVFFLPSVHEPFGIVVLEAWAAGKPVLASRVGGLVDLVEEGVTGWLFPSNQAEAAVQMLQNMGDGQEVAGRALAHCQQNYDWKTLSLRLQTLYQEVCRAHSGH